MFGVKRVDQLLFELRGPGWHQRLRVVALVEGPAVAAQGRGKEREAGVRQLPLESTADTRQVK